MKDLTGKKVFVSSDFHFMHKGITYGTSHWKNEFGEIPLEQVRYFINEFQMSNQLIFNIN